MRNSVTAGARAFLATALLLVAAAPAHGQVPAAAAGGGPCSTEIYLYVEKSVTASTRETAREFLERLNSAPQWLLPGPALVTIYSFAGDVSAFNSISLPVAAGIRIAPGDVGAALHQVAVRSPSDSTTDLVRLFEHVNRTARAVAGPPLNPARRLFIILGDFAHAPLSEQWLAQGSPLTAQLRQIVVTNRNVSLVAIQTPPSGPTASRVHQEVINELGSNFLLFDDWASSQNELAGLLTDLATPLGVNLAINPGAPNPVLQIANHSCTNLPVVTYSVRGDGIAPAVLGGVPAPGLPSGVATAPIPVNLAALRPLVAPGNACANLWIEAEGRLAPGTPPVRRGMAPQPITLGNCAEITDAIFDLRRKLGRSEELIPCEHLPLPPRGNFVTCLRLRGHWDVPRADLTLEELDTHGGRGRVLVRQQINATGNDGFNILQLPGGQPTLAFDGALRYRLYPVTFPDGASVRRQLCLQGKDDEPKRLKLTLTWGAGAEATAILVRRYPAKGDLIPHNEWESGILPLLCLLVATIFISSRLRPAHAGRFSHVLLALAALLLVMGLAAHFASAFGNLVEKSFAQRLEELSTAGVLAVGVVYCFLILMGFFDRRPSARESLREVQKRRYRERKSGFQGATVLAVAVLLVLIVTTLSVIWLFQRDIEECRFTYTAVQEP